MRNAADCPRVPRLHGVLTRDFRPAVSNAIQTRQGRAAFFFFYKGFFFYAYFGSVVLKRGGEGGLAAYLWIGKANNTFTEQKDLLSSHSSK